MNQKPALVAAIALTVFFLTILGALISQVAHENTAARVPALSPASTVASAEIEPAPTLDTSAIKSAIAEREAAYQQLLGQANRQIQEANTQLQKQADELQKAQASARAAQAQVQAQQVQAKAVQPAAPAKPAPPKYAVSVDQASKIAAQAAQGAKIVKTPELVEFEGKVAYEVTFNGGVVYVDANTGKVLYSSVEVQANSDGPSDRGLGGNNGSGHEQEHQDEHHEQEHEQEGH